LTLTRREIAIALLDLGVPTFPLHSHVPQRLRGLALGEDEGHADQADDEEARDQKTQTPHLNLHAFADDAQDEQHDRDLAEAGTHDMEGLGRPIEFDGHDALVSVQVVDVGAGAVVNFGSGDAHEDKGEQLNTVYQDAFFFSDSLIVGLHQDQPRLTNAMIMAQSSRPIEWFTRIRVYSLPYRNSIANAHSVQPMMRMSEPLRTSPPGGGDETFSMMTFYPNRLEARGTVQRNLTKQ